MRRLVDLEKTEKTPQERHNGLMAIYNRAIIRAIANKLNITLAESLDKFYNSDLYEIYEDEKTKIWHFSGVAIANMLVQELNEGKIEFPVEA